MSFRLLIPDELPYSSGVETVAVSIVREWLPRMELVTWLVRTPTQADELRKRLGPAENLRFEQFTPYGSNQNKLTSNSILGMVKTVVKNLPVIQNCAESAYRHMLDSRILDVANKSRSTHCWFHFIQGQSIPTLKIPVCGLVHDQNFRFFPENLPKGKANHFQKSLHQWLEKSDLMTVLSSAGRLEMLELNPQPKPRIEIIPNAIDLNLAAAKTRSPANQPLFFYPAAALSHKNHLQLFQAALGLAESGCDFRIVICGKETDQLLKNHPMGNTGAEKARRFYHVNRGKLSRHIDALGHCSMDIVEKFYAQCWAVVLPSRYEGFGLPLVESLARNAPVLCSRLIPFEEQVERYGAHNWVKWFSPDNTTELATLLEEIISQKKAPLPDQFPRENLKKWTWKQVASRYLEIFEELDQSSSSTQQVS